MFEKWGTAMEKDYLVKSIIELLVNCNDVELLRLIKSLLNVKS